MNISSILVSAALVSASVLGIVASRAVAASDTTNKVVVVVCGPNGAAQITDADKVPVGCHVSTVNSPPASHG
jgi:hypothetical protein